MIEKPTNALFKSPPSDSDIKGWPWIEEVDPTLYDSGSNWPKITIVTPSFNQGHYIEETIRSILLQNYPNLEYIIIDGGSKDNTVDVINKYNNGITYWVSEPDEGQTDAINKGFGKATGDILAWIASDDFYEKGALYGAAKHYMNSGFDLLNGNCFLIEAGRAPVPITSGQIDLERLIKFWKPYFTPPQPSIFFTREVWKTCGPLNTGLNYAMDLQLWLNASLDFKYSFVNEYFSYYRIHSDSKSGSENGMDKFKPEWECVVLQFVKQKLSILQNMKFLKEYSFYKDHPSNRIMHSLSFLKNLLIFLK